MLSGFFFVSSWINPRSSLCLFEGFFKGTELLASWICGQALSSLKTSELNNAGLQECGGYACTGFLFACLWCYRNTKPPVGSSKTGCLQFQLHAKQLDLEINIIWHNICNSRGIKHKFLQSLESFHLTHRLCNSAHIQRNRHKTQLLCSKT